MELIDFKLMCIYECVYMHVFINLHMLACILRYVCVLVLCTVSVTHYMLLFPSTLLYRLYLHVSVCVCSSDFISVCDLPISPMKSLCSCKLYFMDHCHVFVLCQISLYGSRYRKSRTQLNTKTEQAKTKTHRLNNMQTYIQAQVFK